MFDAAVGEGNVETPLGYFQRTSIAKKEADVAASERPRAYGQPERRGLRTVAALARLALLKAFEGGNGSDSSDFQEREKSPSN